MTVKLLKARDAAHAFSIIEKLTFQERLHYIFRGQQQRKWRLTTTLSRHFLSPYQPMTSIEFNEMLSHFFTRLAVIGVQLPFRNDKHEYRAQLEFGRHYGVPSPVVDFSYSPYIALFFAFNGVRPSEARATDYSCLYCVNIEAVAEVWARDSLLGRIDDYTIKRERMRFLYGDNGVVEDDTFENGYKAERLRFMSVPASWNRRMQRQIGCFIYDSLCYPSTRYEDLEHYLEQDEVPTHLPSGQVMLTKLMIPHKAGREIFERLDLMSINGTLLFDSHEGAAMDVINSYSYGRSSGLAWDI